MEDIGETFEDLYTAAKGRIRESTTLEAHENLLLSGVADAGSSGGRGGSHSTGRSPSIEQHYRWIATAPEQEIIDWLRDSGRLAGLQEEKPPHLAEAP